MAAPMTALRYDWIIPPIGQQLWQKWFETLKEFPPMQAAASYNLTQVMKQFKAETTTTGSD
jgi:arylsulfatase